MSLKTAHQHSIPAVALGKGNLGLLCNDDPLKPHLTTTVRNATYISTASQNQLIDAISMVIRRHVVVKAVKYFSIMAVWRAAKVRGLLNQFRKGTTARQNLVCILDIISFLLLSFFHTSILQLCLMERKRQIVSEVKLLYQLDINQVLAQLLKLHDAVTHSGSWFSKCPWCNRLHTCSHKSIVCS